MRTPVRPLPEPVKRWTTTARYLRWLDTLTAWLLLWGLLLLGPGRIPPAGWALIAAVVIGGLAFVPPLRLRWRPVSAAVGLWVSRALEPGDHAWFVRPGGADLVIITARQGARLTIATAAPGAAEGIRVRRTRVLLVPAG